MIAAGTGVEGQIYFDTTVDALKIYRRRSLGRSRCNKWCRIL